MKKHSIKALALTLPLVGSALASPAAFAAVDDYGITYSGGEALGTGNVTIDSDLVGGLSLLMAHNDVSVSFSNSSRWEDGYIKDGSICRKFKYIRVSNSNPIAASDNVSLTFKNDKYSAKVTVDKVNLVNYSDSSKFATFGAAEGMAYIWAGWYVYTTPECTDGTGAEGMNNEAIDMKFDNRLFAKMNIKLYKDGSPFVKNGIHFGITDIDASQSYKILSTGNEFSKNSMIARSASSLQPTTQQQETMPYRNMYVENGKYIYSEYNGSAVEPTKMNLGISTADIYLPLTTATQTSGLDIVFGFGAGAASGIEYYAKQYTINYESDENGTITGITEEKVMEEDNPSGSKTEPGEGYELSYWKANKNVLKCTNGDCVIIEAGESISDEELTKVSILDDTTFTAIHEKAVAVPDTGEIISKEFSGAVVPMSVAGIVTLAIVIFYLPRINHKRVSFKKK